MRDPVVHVIGAGLAGLAAAIRLAEAGTRVCVHEAAGQAGGRCRSYHDATLGMTIDNGNHLVFSGNHATLGYLQTIGAQDRLSGPSEPTFQFVDLKTGARWQLRPNPGRLPWWVLDPARRVPGTRAIDYLGAAPLTWSGREQTIAETMRCDTRLYQLLWHPVLLAALNTEPPQASAHLAGAVIRETLGSGGSACRPLIATDGLAHAFLDPAIEHLQARGASVQLNHRLRSMTFGARHVEGLDFGDDAVRLEEMDAVVLAVPPWVATSLVPGLQAPSEFRAIVNAHFRIAPPPGLAPMIGVVNGTVEWIFSFPDRLSITISCADRLLDVPRETLAADLWKEVAQVTGTAQDLPPWQIIKERRATFAALPREDAKRPAASTKWENLVLAGDWTATDLPATIEGSIRSGNKAAERVRQRHQVLRS
jgi:squalene-associated FAD-dependent desaturase